MPSYKVIEKGFFDGVMYSPDGKRPELHADMPLDPVPTWLEPIKAETATERKVRKTAETKAANAKRKADEEIKAASGVGEGESPSVIETL